MEPKAAQLAATASAALSAPFTTACRVVCASHLSIVSTVLLSCVSLALQRVCVVQCAECQVEGGASAECACGCTAAVAEQPSSDAKADAAAWILADAAAAAAARRAA